MGLNRPKTLNAMNFQMINEVIEAFTRLDEDPRYRRGRHVRTERGTSPRGGDMDMMLGLNYQTGHIWNNKMRRLCMTLRNSGKPTIAMVRGWCIGGGNEWQLYCDLCNRERERDVRPIGRARGARCPWWAPRSTSRF